MKKYANSQKGFTPLVIVLIIVVVGLACGAGYYVWQKNQNIKEVESNVGITASATPAPTTSPVPTKVDESAGWKSYDNSEGAYSFKYPANWNVSVNSKGTSGLFYSVKDGGDYDLSTWTVDYSKMPSNEPEQGKIISPANTKFEDYVTKYEVFGMGSGSAKVTKSESIQTKSGSAFLVTYSDKWAGKTLTPRIAFVKNKEDKVLVMQFKNDASQEEISVYKEIITSVKF